MVRVRKDGRGGMAKENEKKLKHVRNWTRVLNFSLKYELVKKGRMSLLSGNYKPLTAN